MEVKPLKRAHRTDSEAWNMIGFWWNKYVVNKAQGKKKHLFIWGPPGTGKSSNFLDVVQEMGKSYELLDDPQFWPNFEGTYDFGYLDEAFGRIPLVLLNKFCSRSKSNFRTFGRFFKKTQDFPVVICSNLSPQQMYGSDPAFPAFLARFEVAYVSEIKTIF